MRLAPHDEPDFLALAAERLRSEPPHADEALANPRGDHSLDNVLSGRGSNGLVVVGTA